MRRGELYRVFKASRLDPREFKVFVIVSRQTLIDSAFSTLTCAPVYSRSYELSTQVPVGVEAGLKHESAIHCDELVSLPKAVLTDYVGALSEVQIGELNRALRIAVAVED